MEAAVGAWAEVIEHVGSTAVPGLEAKQVVDVLVGLKHMRDAELCVQPLERLGYSYWEEGAEPHHRLFVKFADAGRTARTHNLHLVEAAGSLTRLERGSPPATATTAGPTPPRRGSSSGRR